MFLEVWMITWLFASMYLIVNYAKERRYSNVIAGVVVFIGTILGYIYDKNILN